MLALYNSSQKKSTLNINIYKYVTNPWVELALNTGLQEKGAYAFIYHN